jgi:hypothetical protein
MERRREKIGGVGDREVEEVEEEEIEELNIL